MARFKPLALLAALAASVASIPALADSSAPDQRPNFLVIVADDLGFSDLGAFGGEIATPHLDRLALSGLRLTDFNTAPTCSPTRSMLLSGTDNHRAGLGNMAEFTAPNQKGQPGHEGHLRTDVASLAELLGANGYRTLHSGKWHLGLRPEHDPHARGFHHSFTLLQGSHNHFGTDIGSPAIYRENGVTLTSLPADFYSTDTFTTKLIDQLRTSAKQSEGRKPFFAYLTYTAPHFPLQAPPAEIAKYRGRYDAGFEALRQERLKRQVELGLLDPKVAAHLPALPQGPWESYTPEQKRIAARNMEVYAAMVDRLDQNVGRVIDELKRTGEYDKTVILFLSDNGAAGRGVNDVKLGHIAQSVAAADNSLDNLGAATSYTSYDRGFAQAATAPSWLHKSFPTQGGTRTVSFFAGEPIARKGIGRAYGNVMDVVPTFLDLAGVPAPAGEFQGRKVQPIRGKSWAPYLQGRSERVYAPDEAVGTELFGTRALRRGDWKITDIGDGQWRLFDLANDPGETRDLALEQPARLTELKTEWDRYAREVGVIMPTPALDHYKQLLPTPAQ